MVTEEEEVGLTRPVAARARGDFASHRQLAWFSAVLCILVAGALWLQPSWAFGALVGDAGAARIYFAHVHKAGGSSLCGLARANGERTTRTLTTPRGSFESNCNPSTDEQHVVLATGTVEQQEQAQQQLQKFTFIANEYGLPDAWRKDPKTFVYITMLRKPGARYLSHFAHEQLGGAAYSSGANRRLNTSLFCTWLSNQPCNFMTRYFAGQSSRAKPRGQLTKQDLERARGRLAQFDIVLTLESFDSAVQEGFIRRAVGWKSMRPPHGGTKVHANDRLPEQQCARKLVSETLSLDRKLYTLAEKLHKQSRQRLLYPRHIWQSRSSVGVDS